MARDSVQVGYFRGGLQPYHGSVIRETDFSLRGSHKHTAALVHRRLTLNGGVLIDGAQDARHCLGGIHPDTYLRAVARNFAP